MQFDAKLLSVESINDEIFILKIERPETLHFQPGQFVHLKIKDASYPLLRRPISVYRENEESFSLLIKKQGPFTRSLALAQEGLLLDILGPLGNAFPIEKDAPVVILGGGIGIAPVSFLAETFHEERVGYDAYLGYREEPYGQELFNFPVLHSELRDPGFVTGLLEERLQQGDHPVVYACGPTPMLKAVKALSEHYGVKAYLSLEEHMACGVGACVGCTVKTRRDEDFVYRKVCVDGPVFLASEVLWDE